MKKRPVSKKKISVKKQVHSRIYVGYVTVIFGVFMLFFVVRLGYHTVFQPQVLGSSTSLLARAGDGSGDSGSGSLSNTTGGSQPSSGDSHPGDTTVSGDSAGVHFSGSTLVSCTGPDGNTFQTTLSNCQDLNQRWHHQTTFTPVNKHTIPVPPITPKPEHENETETTDGLPSNLTQAGTKIQVRTKDGKLELTAVKPDGTEEELDDSVLHELNHSREGSVSAQIDQDGDGFLLRQGSVSARTHFPLSIDVTTGQLSVTTPAGTKQVAILPEQAVDNLIAHHVITDVTRDASDSASQVDLTETQNEPVFRVHGISKQHLLGIIPVSIQKKVEVSALTGQTISEQETLGQKILDFLSL